MAKNAVSLQDALSIAAGREDFDFLEGVPMEDKNDTDSLLIAVSGSEFYSIKKDFIFDLASLDLGVFQKIGVKRSSEIWISRKSTILDRSSLSEKRGQLSGLMAAHPVAAESVKLNAFLGGPPYQQLSEAILVSTKRTGVQPDWFLGPEGRDKNGAYHRGLYWPSGDQFRGIAREHLFPAIRQGGWATDHIDVNKLDRLVIQNKQISDLINQVATELHLDVPTGG